MKRSLRSWLWRVPIDQEVDNEIAFHIEMRTRELVDKGMDPRLAREMVTARIGDSSRLKRTCVDLGRKRDRELRVTQWLEELRDDVKFAVRQFRMSPGFTLVATLTLALGIGANSAIFALADATLVRPLSFVQPDRLTMLWESNPNGRSVVAPFEFIAWSERNHSFDVMAAGGWPASRATTGADGVGQQLDAQFVTVRFFEVFGVKPILGRTFIAEDDRPDSDVIIISEGFWRTRLGADPNVVGRSISLDGQPVSVVGVMPAGFQVLARTDVWTVFNSAYMRSPAGVAHFLRVVGRLRPRATLEQAQADMDGIARALERERPEMNRDRGITIEPLREALVGRELQLTSILLLGVVGFVLLMCCGNVANLLLARTAARRRELAVRSALGAGRRRVVRQLLTESLVLALLGGVAGAGVGIAILKAAPTLIPTGVLPVSITLEFDGRVLAFCAVTAFVVAIAFGAAPARQATGVSLVELMMSGSRTATAHGTRLRRALAVVQVAVSVLLLCGAGLLLRTLFVLEDVDSGSGASDVLTMEVSVPFPVSAGNLHPGRYATETGRANFYDAVEREVSAVPGVKRAAWGSALPLDGFWVAMAAMVDGDPPKPEGLRPRVFYELISASYFRTLDIPLLRGRHFDNRDTAAAAPVCIVDEAFVRIHLRGRDPIGARVVVRGMNNGGRPLPIREIVGVVAQVRQRPDELDGQPHVYAPLAQDPAPRASLVVQASAGPASALAPAIRSAVARIDRERPVANIRTLADITAQATSRPRFRAVLVGTFAALALVLALVGVFGLIGYSVQQRLREFGVRVALGATRASVIRLVLADARRVVAVGILIGLAGAAALARSIGSFLFGVQPLDVVTFVSVAVVLGLTAALATAIPALRAARVDPVEAFRNE
jgi:putative ABC transport system permease protein